MGKPFLIGCRLESDFIELKYKGYTYSVERFYYVDKGDTKFTTDELEQDTLDRVKQEHRDRIIGEILKKN